MNKLADIWDWWWDEPLRAAFTAVVILSAICVAAVMADGTPISLNRQQWVCTATQERMVTSVIPTTTYSGGRVISGTTVMPHMEQVCERYERR